MKRTVKFAACFLIYFTCLIFLSGCSSNSSNISCYIYSNSVGGCAETIDHIKVFSIVSTDESVFKAEYLAGFIQGKLQGNSVVHARDNIWDNTYLTDPSHSFPKQIPPSAGEIETMRQALLENYNYTINFIASQGRSKIGINMKRLLFRMLGVYHGVMLSDPRALDFSGNWLPGLTYFSDFELAVNYGTAYVSFMDVFFINASQDVFGAIPAETGGSVGMRHERCSAFIKKYDDDIAIAHNAWDGFLDQSLAINLYVNGLYQTLNSLKPGMITSEADFGYTSHGLMYTGIAFHPTAEIQGKTDAIWDFWKAALAEQFSSSIDEFYEYYAMNIDNLGKTSFGGFLVVDTKTNEIGTIENSQQSLVYIKSNRTGSYDVITNPSGLSTEYDTQMVNPNYIIAINYPTSTQIRNDLKAIDTRPARKVQFLDPKIGIATVKDVETAKSLITYTDPANPLSIYGRWDLGYGETPTPKTIPAGSIDAKVVLASMTRYVSSVQGVLDTTSGTNAMWMKYGTPYINGKPFIWSESLWKVQTLRDVPDRVDGSFQLLRSYVK